LLTGERGHYEIAAGHDPGPCLRALEQFSQGIGLIPEQIWDAPDLPSRHLRFGGPTGSAQPLLWAHAEYIKLQRSAAEGRIFDLIEAAYNRYVRGGGERPHIEVWKSGRQVPVVAPATILRVQANSPFLLHWTTDEWHNPNDTRSTNTAVEVHYVDIPLPIRECRLRFTLLWTEQNRWEGKDYQVEVQARAKPRARGAAYGTNRAA
jgi:glucoamylase